ncbi:hypothetical protein P12x_003208 [Tundrisphaera lichenicola]|uniref:hypothetical protein n=1 Tax=Tundrisphaera lichenicola TaxID=2029860 RepID=UPI003EC0EACD
MDGPAARRLTLGDCAILIATTAIGVWIWKIAHESRTPGQLQFVVQGGYPPPWSLTIGLDLSPFLLTTAIGLILARLHSPRPGFRELTRQPGLIASLAILASVLYSIAFGLGHLWFSAALRRTGFSYGSIYYLSIGLRTGEAVVIAWATLALIGAWQPESSWVDRAGRVLGVCSILIWIATRLSL